MSTSCEIKCPSSVYRPAGYIQRPVTEHQRLRAYEAPGRDMEITMGKTIMAALPAVLGLVQ